MIVLTECARSHQIGRGSRRRRTGRGCGQGKGSEPGQDVRDDGGEGIDLGAAVVDVLLGEGL